MSNVFIGVRVPAELKERLQAEATDKGVSLSAVLRAYLENEWANAPVPWDYEAKGEPGTIDEAMAAEKKTKPTTAGVVAPVGKKAISEQELRAKAMELVRSKDISFRAAIAEVRRNG